MREYQKQKNKKPKNKKTILIKFVGKEFGFCNILELPEIEYRHSVVLPKVLWDALKSNY